MVHSCMLNQLCHRQLGNEWWYCYPVVFSTTADKHPEGRVSYSVIHCYLRKRSYRELKLGGAQRHCSTLHIVLQCVHCKIIILYSIGFNLSWVASVAVYVYT